MTSRRPPFSAVRSLTTALLALTLQVSIWPDANAIPASNAIPATGAEPRFLIQAVEVRGARHVSPSVVVAESLLEDGRVYTESELLEALRRIRHLPFVLEADFALARGRERGSYVLVVDVVETKRFVYELGLEQSLFEEPVALDAEGRLTDNLAGDARVAGRLFVGRYDMLFAAAGNEGAQVGYTRYDLFDRNAVLRVGLAAERCCATSLPPLGLDPVFASWIDDGDASRATLDLTVPLGARSAIHAGLARRESDRGVRRLALGAQGLERTTSLELDVPYENRRDDELRLAWLYDSTDDPVVPFDGTSMIVAFDYRTLKAELTGDVEMSSELVRVSVHGRRHWPLARRHSLATGFSVSVGRADVENAVIPPTSSERLRESLDTLELSASVRHSMRLHSSGGSRVGGFAQLYWQNQVEYFWNKTSPDFTSTHGPIEIAALSSALVWRHAWGIVRIGLRLIDMGDVL